MIFRSPHNVRRAAARAGWLLLFLGPVGCGGGNITTGTGDLFGGGTKDLVTSKEVAATFEYVAANRGHYAIPTSEWCPSPEALALVEQYSESAARTARKMGIRIVAPALFDGNDDSVDAYVRPVRAVDGFDSDILYTALIREEKKGSVRALTAHEAVHPENPSLNDQGNLVLRGQLNGVGECIDRLYVAMAAPGRRLWQAATNVSGSFSWRPLQVGNHLYIASLASVNGSSQCTIQRLGLDGQLDAGFETNGIISFPNLACRGLKVDSKGRLILYGEQDNPNGDGGAWRIYRFLVTAAGKLERDGSFNGDGAITGAFSVNSWLNLLNDVLVRSDDSLIAVGSTWDSAARQVRWETIVTNISEDGVVRVRFRGPVGHFKHSSAARAIALPNDEFLVLANSWHADASGVYRSEMLFLRMSDSGGVFKAWDRDFGAPMADGQDLMLLPDGKVLVSGVTRDRAKGWSFFVVARFDDTGELDTTFGTNGTISVSEGEDKGGATMLPDGDGLWLFGNFRDGTGRKTGLFQYDGRGKASTRNLTPGASRPGFAEYAANNRSVVPGATKLSNGSIALHAGNTTYLLLGNQLGL